MSANEPTAPPTPQSIAKYVQKNASKVQDANEPTSHHGGGETVREANYHGHRIVVRTTYRVEIDGVPITGHLGVSDDGQVHYHAVPNVAYASALDLLKALIDIFPDDFRSGGGHHHAGAARGRRGPKDSATSDHEDH